MSLKIYNSLTRSKDEFEPLNPPRVGIYVCGPTVYGHSHFGHAKSYVSFDVIVRWLRQRGFEVNYVQNITDVGHLTDDADAGEDKIVAEARRRGLHPMAVAETFTQSYLEDMDALGNQRPDILPRASGHIPEQIALVERLIERGHAYDAGGSVYFDVASFKAYGRLSGRSVDELEAGARVAVKAEKRHPADFALWKQAEPGHLMRWPSPWGDGYPGWHLECTVMAQKYLGETIDIHGGGLENKFPHHECEIAQGECASGQPYVRYWLHNNMCTVNGQKMGKSLGNAISLKQAFRDGHPLLTQTFEPVVIRHFILTSHYRQPLDFSSEALQGAQSGTYKLRDALATLRAALPRAPERASSSPIREALARAEDRFVDALNDDFNTAAGLATLFDLSKQTNTWVHEGAGQADLAAAESLFTRLAEGALGLRWATPKDAGGGREDELIQLLADLRNEARREKRFDLADTIRDRLGSVGVELKDTPDGTTW